MKSLGKDLIRLNSGGGLGESPKRPSQTWNLSSVLVEQGTFKK